MLPSTTPLGPVVSGRLRPRGDPPPISEEEVGDTYKEYVSPYPAVLVIRHDSLYNIYMGRKAILAAAMSVIFLSGCETQESLTGKRIKQVEKGLLRAVTIKGQKPEKLALSARMPFYRVPGLSLAVMDRHELEWAKAYGVLDARTQEPATTETLFQAGALARPLSAAAALILVSQGRLDLDGPAHARLEKREGPPDESAGQARVTLRELLTDDPEAGDAVLQHLLEDSAGKPFPALLSELVLGPLGMTRSAFKDAPSEGPPASAASGYDRDGRPVQGGPLLDPAPAAAGLWTSPAELVSFAADLMASAMDKGGRLLPPPAARAMLTPQAGTRSFGLAIEGSGQDVRFHLRGRTAGFACTLDIYPYRGQGAVIMTNSANGLLLADEVLRALAEVYGWPDFKPVEKTLYRLDPSIYAGYVGRYEVTPEYALEVTHEDYYLVIRPTGQAPTRFYVESQTFFFSVDPYIRIQFHTGEKGDVTGLTLWQQDFKQEARKVG
ncbi:MAG: serine hydrolase [Candidatus Aminicenantes bacterium]|nr:serine hydrolase [Candidatus Aminicenantes bacterium]